MRIGKGWLFASTFLLAASAQAMTADELVAKNVAARGGMESLQAIKSLRLSGKMLIGAFGVEVDAVQIYKRPGAYRFEGTLQGMTMVQSYDGKEAWRIFPFQGRKDPERTSADDAKSLAEQADFDGGWVDAAAKGKIILAAKKGQQLPEGWAMDRRGRPTTDPQEAIDGLVMPLGGHKGYALSLMIDLLCGILTGASFGAFYSANAFFRKPWLFDTLIAMSGFYDLAPHYLRGYSDDNCYYNNAAFAALTLIVGFAEETFFRGLILTTLLPTGAIRAVILSSLLFAAPHLLNIIGGLWDPAFTLVDSIAAFGLGITFAAIRLRTGSIWPVIGIHAFFDFTSLVSLGGITVTAQSLQSRAACAIEPWLRREVPLSRASEFRRPPDKHAHEGASEQRPNAGYPWCAPAEVPRRRPGDSRNGGDRCGR